MAIYIETSSGIHAHCDTPAEATAILVALGVPRAKADHPHPKPSTIAAVEAVQTLSATGTLPEKRAVDVAGPAPAPKALTSTDHVIAALRYLVRCDADQIVHRTGLTPHQVGSVLPLLVKRGVVRVEDGRYELVRGQ